MERFFLNLKMERVWQRKYANQIEAIKDVSDYIVGFYNVIGDISAGVSSGNQALLSRKCLLNSCGRLVCSHV